MLDGGPELSQSTKPITVVRDQGRLLIEICHFTQDLNPVWTTSEMIDRLKALRTPIYETLAGSDEDSFCFEAIRDHFFNKLNFRIRDMRESRLQNSFLPHVLNSQCGPAPLLMLLLVSLCEEFGIHSQVCSCRERHLLKVKLDGRFHIVDFSDSCRFLEPFEIVDLINEGFDFSNVSTKCDSLVVEYFNTLAKLARKEDKLQILSKVHSYLMRYQPFNLKHISERAIVAYETGDYRRAVDDIRSYFQYKQQEFTNPRLKKIYKLARKKERARRREV